MTFGRKAHAGAAQPTMVRAFVAKADFDATARINGVGVLRSSAALPASRSRGVQVQGRRSADEAVFARSRLGFAGLIFMKGRCLTRAVRLSVWANRGTSSASRAVGGPFQAPRRNQLPQRRGPTSKCSLELAG